MRDYDNMPVLDWASPMSAQKARAQILHQEPVILQMPDNFDPSLDGEVFGCEQQGDNGILYNCEGGNLLNHLAKQNNMEELSLLADACVESSSQVDIDASHKRLIVHD